MWEVWNGSTPGVVSAAVVAMGSEEEVDLLLMTSVGYDEVAVATAVAENISPPPPPDAAAAMSENDGDDDDDKVVGCCCLSGSKLAFNRCNCS